jgi:hypothetical protein
VGSGGFAPDASAGAGGDLCAWVIQPEDIVVYPDAGLADAILLYEPAALYFMIDRSSSMVDSVNDPTNWVHLTRALTNFVNDPASAGLNVGLGAFPALGNDSTCNDPLGTCCTTGAECAQPIADIATLPGNSAPILDALNRATPPPNVSSILFTPAECGLRGVIDQCALYQVSTGIRCAAVFVTDGMPTLCDPDVGNLTNIVTTGFNDADVATFVLALPGADIAFSDQLAQAGGTDCTPNGPGFACDLSAGAGGVDAALDTIRSEVSEPKRVTAGPRPAVLDCGGRSRPHPTG